MTDKTFWQSFKGVGSDMLERVKQLIHEGNVRRIIVEQRGRTVAVFPLTAGVVGAIAAPVAAAIGAIIALMSECTIHLERVEHDPTGDRLTSR